MIIKYESDRIRREEGDLFKGIIIAFTWDIQGKSRTSQIFQWRQSMFSPDIFEYKKRYRFSQVPQSRVAKLLQWDRAGWLRGNDLDLYSGGARFEFRQGLWLSWGFPWLYSVPPGASIKPRALPSKSFPIHRLSYQSILNCTACKLSRTTHLALPQRNYNDN
jgi:hypothetical protein